MQATKAFANLVFLMPLICVAATDPECLKHLGGAFAGVECYNGLSNDMAEENKVLLSKISSTIPHGNKNKILLKKYEQYRVESKKYCVLSRDSYMGWVSEKKSVNPRYYDYDVVYHECIYDQLVEQNKFLKKIFWNTSQ